ncbi:MAG: cupin domain-containing protein [Steroidobacteraceae bacterium]|jgi:quercetin dioxygenase-like cupin family protein
MFNRKSYRPYTSKFGMASVAILLCASSAQAQSPAAPTSHAAGNALVTRDAVGMPGMEMTMNTVEYAPGASSPPHRHDAQVFVYVLEGHVVMQVKGGPKLTLGPGQTFYESPTDIHSVSANASSTEPAKFLVVMLKNKNAKTHPVAPEQAQ